jgi:phosphoribosylformylglycinamidine synthase
VKGVVKGIGDYGNAFGIPTVGGEVQFDDCYNVNPLVNAFSAGILKVGTQASAISYGVGNPVFIVGSATGKDGIGGASFASEDITAKSSEKLPAVQVGDPFQEKLLLEASLEIIEAGCVIGIQDMGAAGIICSTSEMSAKGEHGMIIDLSKVPTRQANMQPFEILLSESQERMLIVVEKGREHEAKRIFDKWDLNCEQIGTVTDTKRLEFYQDGVLVADVPADDLVLGGGAPVYHREYKEPAYYQEFKKFKIDSVADLPKEELPKALNYMMNHPNIASKKWVAQQYDSSIGRANRNTNAPSDAAVVKVHGSQKSIVITVDCNSRYVNADPEEGCAMAVAEAARNIVCSGGVPVAITNCLNFGNPYVPEVYWQFVGAIKGMKKACEAFETPVTGGNVSFYNQSSDEGPVFPTPTIGMLGILEDPANKMTLDFKKEGDAIYLVGESVNDIASSEYVYSYKGIKATPAPHFDLATEQKLQKAITSLIENKLIESAHDVSDGGLLVTLAESAFPRGLGFSVNSDASIRQDAFWFGESQSRVVVSVDASKKSAFEAALQAQGVKFSALGSVQGTDIIADGSKLSSVAAAYQSFDTALETALMK